MGVPIEMTGAKIVEVRNEREKIEVEIEKYGHNYDVVFSVDGFGQLRFSVSKAQGGDRRKKGSRAAG